MGDERSPERVYKTFDGLLPDRVPVQDLIANIGVLEHYGREKINPKNACSVTIRALREILDVSQCEISIPESLESKIHTAPDGFVYKGEWWTQTVIERPFKTLDELERFVKSDIDKIYSAIADGKISDAAILSSTLRSKRDIPLTPEYFKQNYRELAKELCPIVLMLPAVIPCLTTAYVRAGLDFFSYLYMDNKKLVSDWLEAITAHEIFRIEGMADSSISRIAVVADDVAFNSGLMFPKSFLNEEFFPRLKRINDVLKSKRYKILFHSDGDKRSIIPELIESGIDAINPLETDANMWVGDIRKDYPDLILTNPIDANTLLTLKSPGDVKDTVIRAFNEAGKNGRLTLGSSLQVQPVCKPENAIAMYETIRSECRY